MTTPNGEVSVYKRNTETPAPRPGADELRRVLAAKAAGNAPDPANLAVLQVLLDSGPMSAAAVDVGALMEDLHGGDPTAPAAALAREQLAGLIFDPVDALDVVSRHASNPAAISWLVDGWMPDATLSVLTGAGGAGKSRIALQLAVAVAIGADGFLLSSGRHRPLSPTAPAVLDQGPVVFAAWETRRLAFANRLAAICGPDGPERQAIIDSLADRLHYVNMRPSGGLWGARPGETTSTAGSWLPKGGALFSLAERVGARLLIIDPLAAAFVANENDRALVRSFLSALDQWADDAGCAVLTISHPPKTGDPQSGSTDWRNGVQAVWQLAPADDPGGARVLKVDKLNEGPIPAPVQLDFEAGRFVEVLAGGGVSAQGTEAGDSTTDMLPAGSSGNKGVFDDVV